MRRFALGLVALVGIVAGCEGQTSPEQAASASAVTTASAAVPSRGAATAPASAASASGSATPTASGGAVVTAPPVASVAVKGGTLDPKVIQRIMRMNRGRFRKCYEDALRDTPKLSGVLAIQFVIKRDGGVMHPRLGPGSTLRSPTVAPCVLKALSGLTFPRPEGGIVTVSYPITFGAG